jgi:hypothetical protein
MVNNPTHNKPRRTRGRNWARGRTNAEIEGRIQGLWWLTDRWLDGPDTGPLLDFVLSMESEERLAWWDNADRSGRVLLLRYSVAMEECESLACVLLQRGIRRDTGLAREWLFYM